jgi:fusaric acid resistance family protein
MTAKAAQLARSKAWPLLQGTLAATLAWVIAKRVFHHHEPFFAPIAAVVALNAAPGERGLNAVRLLLGVVLGIVAGELGVAAFGGGYVTLGLATFAAMAVAEALGGARITIAQAAAGAILTVAVANGDYGVERLLDALVGGGVALVFTQLLFAPEPVALLRRSESAALGNMADGLGLTARALEADDDDLAERAVNRLRDVRDRLAELGRTREASGNVSRRSVVWRSQINPVVDENENAGYLDLLGGSCVVLTRCVTRTSGSERRKLAPAVRELAEALSQLACEPGERETRQRVADHALDVARRHAAADAEPDSPLAVANVAVRMVAADTMVVTGVDIDEAEAAVRKGTGSFDLPTQPPTPRTPFPLKRKGQRHG